MRNREKIDDYLDSVPWPVLFDAYGPATRLKKFLQDLHTGTQDEKDDAINDGLWGHAIHQSTYCTATLFAVPPVVMALRDGIRHDVRGLLEFLCECAKIGTYRLRWGFPPPIVSPLRLLQLPFLIGVGLPSLETEISRARLAYEELAESSDSDIRQKARLLLEFCESVDRKTTHP